ncbi:MAG: helix-turn-helix transcriptional regulator [Candidatus Heimdallarchaeota archaeon]|nr:helix-turn-helix transcriptional regulator [Candidatus Heimdallarchaeota archaeon]
MTVEQLRCPLCEILPIIGKKWSILLLNAIGNQKKIRYNKLKKVLRGINSKVLSQRLKELERAELILRKSYDEIPPKVEYSLSEKGRSLRTALLPLLEWFYSQNEKTDQTPCDIAYQKLLIEHSLFNKELS